MLKPTTIRFPSCLSFRLIVFAQKAAIDYDVQATYLGKKSINETPQPTKEVVPTNQNICSVAHFLAHTPRYIPFLESDAHIASLLSLPARPPALLPPHHPSPHTHSPHFYNKYLYNHHDSPQMHTYAHTHTQT